MTAPKQKEAPAMATAPDISKLSFAELQKLVQEAQQLVTSKREEELKVLTDGYAKKLQAAGFSVDAGIEELTHYLPDGLDYVRKDSGSKKTRAPRGSKPKLTKPYEKGTTYVNPANKAETWVGGSKGRMKPWLRTIIEALPADKQADKFKELAAK